MVLTNKKCIPCENGEPPLNNAQISQLKPEVPDWQVTDIDGHPVLTRIFTFPSFAEAVGFVNKIKDIAEAEGHHPDLHVHWNTVRVTNWTHATGGLHQNDFILAAKIDQIQTPSRN